MTRVTVAGLLLLLLFGLGGAFAQEDWEITSFHTEVVVNRNASISVLETIEVDFQGPHRGIYRDIPIRYVNFRGKRVKLRLRLREVTWEDGTPCKRKVSREGADLRIKIGDPDVTVTGEHTYLIRYDIPWAVGYFKDYDEIYWNASGHEWPVPMEKVTATVILPAELKAEQVRAAIYAGPLGAGEGGGKWRYEAPDKVHFEAEGPLPPGQGLTVSVGWPKGLVAPPSKLTMAVWAFLDRLPWMLAAIVWVIAIWMLLTRGKDPAGRGTIVAQYEPPEGMTPAEVGTLVDERMQIKDLSAMIVDLAVRRYLKIVDEGKKLLSSRRKYSLELLRPDYTEDKSLKNFEKKILSALFSAGRKERVSLEKLPSDFGEKANEARGQVYEALVKDNYFAAHPGKVKVKYGVMGAGVIFVGFLVGAASQSPAWIGSFFLMGLPWIAFCWLMPQRTRKGVLSREEIVGFKEYLATAEKDRMRFYEQEHIFDKFLPFAMALGVAHLWAKAFRGILKEEREWYDGSISGSSFSNFSAGAFTSGFSSSLGSALSPASGGGGSGSGGGGSSGGGGGGGGGGAW